MRLSKDTAGTTQRNKRRVRKPAGVCMSLIDSIRDLEGTAEIKEAEAENGEERITEPDGYVRRSPQQGIYVPSEYYRMKTRRTILTVVILAVVIAIFAGFVKLGYVTL